jgi:hypothetical protein
VERRRRAAAFHGGFDLDAAVAVAAGGSRGQVADLIGRLADKSLLVRHHGPPGSRWQMLETIRAYALDRLADSGDGPAVRDAYLDWAAALADDLEQRAVSGRPWRDAFDAAAGDLRAARAAPAGPGSEIVRGQLARALGHLAYARRFMVEAREHYEAAAGLGAGPAGAASDLRAAADVALTTGHGDLAFGLLLAAAQRAAAADDGAARAVALAHAATIADRFAAEFRDEVPHERLRELLAAAARCAPAGDPVSAAYLAIAAAWTAQPEKTVPDPGLAPAALAAARRTGDPVLITGALDAVVGGLDAGGRLRDAHRVNAERARLLDQLPRHDPRAGVEVVDTFHMVTEIATTAGDLPAALATARLAAVDDIAAGQPYRSASKPVVPLVLQGRFDEAAAQAVIMWEAWEQAGRPPARWMGPAVYAMALARGLRGDDAGRRAWLARVGELVGTVNGRVSQSNLAAAAAFTEARVALHAGHGDVAAAAVADRRGRGGGRAAGLGPRAGRGGPGRRRELLGRGLPGPRRRAAARRPRCPEPLGRGLGTDRGPLRAGLHADAAARPGRRGPGRAEGPGLPAARRDRDLTATGSTAAATGWPACRRRCPPSRCRSRPGHPGR